MNRDQAGDAIYAALDTVPETLGIHPSQMRFLIIVEFGGEARKSVGHPGVILSDAGTEGAAKMSIDAMRAMCAEAGIEVGMIDLEAVLAQAEAEAKARPPRVGAGRRPGRKRRSR